MPERQRKLDFVFFKGAKDLEIQVFAKRLEVPVIWGQIPIQKLDAEGIRTEFVEEDAGGIIRIHSFVVVEFVSDNLDDLFNLLTRCVQWDMNFGVPANVRPPPDVLDVATGQLVIWKCHQVASQKSKSC